MELLDLLILGAAALATSALTATVGLGGGVVLLTIMLIWYEPLVAIPVHGVVQMISNGSRTVIQRRHVDWSVLGRFALPLLPFGALGLWVAQSLSAELVRPAIGVFVILATWAPRALFLGVRPEALPRNPRFLLLGALVGFFSPTIGATGPLQGPFFQHAGFGRHALVGTFAACQTLAHLAKIGLFAAVGFAFAAYWLPIVWLGAGVVIGTWLGSRVLDRVNERVFVWLYRGVLTAVALRLIVGGGLALLRI